MRLGFETQAVDIVQALEPFGRRPGGDFALILGRTIDGLKGRESDLGKEYP